MILLKQNEFSINIRFRMKKQLMNIINIKIFQKIDHIMM